MSLLLAVALLAVVLVAATVRPFGLPEIVLAAPAAVLTVVAGLLTPAAAWAEIAELAPTVGFLSAILLLGHLADAEGVFRWVGDRLGAASDGSPRRLLVLVFAVAAGTTAVLSLDATVVLLTPVVLATAARRGWASRPHSYACVHLSNSASGLLPVSNLTNLLAFSASGLGFLGFAGLMAAPWVAVIVVEYLVLRWYFTRDLLPAPAVPGSGVPGPGPGFPPPGPGPGPGPGFPGPGPVPRPDQSPTPDPCPRPDRLPGPGPGPDPLPGAGPGRIPDPGSGPVATGPAPDPDGRRGSRWASSP
ncbi:SLC13 family permease [Pseudonocardia sp. EC080625-04]|uniref:SLC13 family permease n=1 Tax=Pseudonocardia sp. EC080625-04 TaxID=1096868 RepID=UPI000760E557